MTGNIFPIKLLSYIHALKNTQAFSTMKGDAQQAKVNSPNDDMERLMLWSPEIKKEVSEYLKKINKDQIFKVRMAIPEGEINFLDLTKKSQLEVYDENGKELISPMNLCELESNLANAVQVELMSNLLNTTSIDIPMM